MTPQGTKRSAATALQDSAADNTYHSAPNKKKKIDPSKQSFYAVRVGRQVGVFTTWDECKAQTWGYRGSEYSKHDSKKDAEAALAGKLVASASSKKKKPRYYAVAVGHQTGVFTSWPDVAPLIKGFKGAKQQGFDTEEEALQFIKNNANHDATKALGEKAGSAKVHVKQEEKEEKVKKVKKEDKEITVEPLPDDEGKLNIWTDGASRGNGQLGARAGLGVYFGPSDPRNISERLPGEPQTNQRAELMAIQRALEVVPDAQDILIYSDSQYSIKCLTIWSINWRKNHWKTSTGQDVKNRDIVEEVVRLIQERKGKTDFKWVKGHAMDEGNEAADVLAVKGAMMN